MKITEVISTEERLENAIKNRPNNYSTVRDKKGKLLQVEDFDSGRTWIKQEEGWIWLD